jgi:hypothetical protein
MPSLEPETLPVNPERPNMRSKFGVLTIVVPLLLSVIGNVVQWRSNSAEAEKSRAAASQLRQEADKTAAEVQRLKQDQAESGERSVQSWLEELKKFDAPEDRAMVLSAAISTSSDERVKSWARDQLQLVEQALTERKHVAEAQLAVAENAAHLPGSPANPWGGGVVNSTMGTPGSGLTNATGGGVGGHSSALPAMAATPTVAKDPKLAARELASRDLKRITHAETLLKTAK